MSRYQFRLESVLRVRRVQEDRARAQLARARLDEAEALRATKERRGRLRRAEQAVMPTSEPTEWRSQRDRTDRLAAAVTASHLAEVHAAELSGSRLEQWERAAADLRALERLDERTREEWRAEQLRDEQRTIDEISTRKRP